MFVKRKRNIISILHRFRHHSNDIAFINKKRMVDFTIGKVYKPFAYTFNGEDYKDFCIFDDAGRAMYMENGLIDEGRFEIVYTNLHDLEFQTHDIMAAVDRENERYKEELKLIL